jgi:exopolysaccharide production protein ExoZ
MSETARMASTGNAAIIPRPGKRLDGVQICRGLAALAVVLYHINLQCSAFVPGTPDLSANPWPWTVHRLGFLGVDFFFVLSGFIIHHIHRRDLGLADRGRTFLLKRFFRIQPLLIVIVLLKQAYLTFGAHDPEDWKVVLSTALALPGDKMVGVVWSLTFEWMFYLFFLTCILSGGRWLWGLGSAWMVVVIAASSLDRTDWSPWLEVVLDPYVGQFFCGVLAAEGFRRWPDRPRMAKTGVGSLLLVMLLVGLIVDPFNLTPREWAGSLDKAFGRYFWGATFGLLVWWTAVNDAWFRSRYLAPLVLLGNASYSLYLFHNELLQGLIRVGHAVNLYRFASVVFWMWAFAFVLLGAGVVIHLVIERPILRWSRGLVAGRRGGDG